MTQQIPATVVKELRDQTGAGMMDCKRALAECGGDIENAKDWLRKRGQAIADKKASRKASEGLIFTHISPDGRIGSILELNCETDFVARNEAFIKLGEELTRAIAAGAPGSATGNVEKFLASPSTVNPAQPVSELLREKIATIGENLGVGGFARVETPGETSHLQTYIHLHGKLGVMLEVRVGNVTTKANPAFLELCRDVAMQIAASAPAFLDSSAVTPERLERERAIYREQALLEGKNEKFLDKIIEGRLAKYYKESCLIDQEFVKNPDESVRQLVDRVSKLVGDTITLAGFHRLKVGA